MKYPSLSLLTTLLLSMVPSLVSASDIEIDGIFYELDSDAQVAIVTYQGDSEYDSEEYSGSVVIPESVTYKGVTYNVAEIGQRAFAVCRNLTSIAIPSTVYMIGSGAFEDWQPFEFSQGGVGKTDWFRFASVFKYF